MLCCQSDQFGSSDIKSPNVTAGRQKSSLLVVPSCVAVLPGYRDVVLGVNQKTLAWLGSILNAEAPWGQQLPRIRKMEEEEALDPIATLLRAGEIGATQGMK